MKIWSWAPDGELTQRQTGRLTVSRDIVLTSNELVVWQSAAGKNVGTEAEDVVESSHQTTTGEDTADWADLVRAVVNCRVCELAIEL
jgi:hypothetical protein